MMDYTTRKETITSIVNSIDFSKHTFFHRNDVKFAANGIDLSALPCADISVVDKAISDIAEHMNGVKEAIEKSRLGESNKASALELAGRVNQRIETAKNPTDDDSAMNKWYCIDGAVRELAGLLKCVPSSVKDNVNRAYRLASICRKEVEKMMEERSSIILELEDAILEASEKHDIAFQKETIADKKLTLDVICAKDYECADIRSAYRDAVCNVAYERYGRGGCDLVRAILHTPDGEIPKMEWVSDYQVKDLVACANEIGIKTFMFTDHSTAALECLCELATFGATFRFEITNVRERFSDDLRKEHRAIVILP